MINSIKRKILIIDDDKIQHLLFQRRIAILKIEVDMIFFEEAQSALHSIKSSPPDVIVSDINLHKMNGWKFLELLKGMNFEGKFYFLSGSISPEDRTRSKEDSFVTDFFEKPIKQTDLNYILSH